ncbi:MAG: GNAT family N-acetyltransferase [Beijerinckiaceae bacterium]|jgi:ribosomal protein S18 acetylase RimI-like enzyme|nr:GNAT family N-acetyltransferase [Beijerinckiaceae bacterium]
MPRIVEGWRPGALGFIIGEHGQYYARHWGFGAYFEAKVAAGLAEFTGRMEPSTDRFFLAIDDADQILGSLILDLTDPAEPESEAHLRWFILSDAARGRGLGEQLMSHAMAHCDAHSSACWLTTFAGLDAARALYERHGFSLIREEEAASWGTKVREQLFRRPARR